jgi:putative peptide zinc metalloprotease protein
LLLFLPISYTLAIVAHEAGHALAVKHFGRDVDRMGIGWYWFGPIAFIDTSDMWLSGRRERIWVSLAGPWGDLVIGGLAGIAALLLSSPEVAAVSWQFALACYIAVVINLNPLLELDGYYVLSDWLDRPNLRSQALAWIGRAFPGFLRRPAEMKAHKVELAYGTLAVLYIPVAAYFSLFVYRRLAESMIARWAPPGIADTLAWVVVSAGIGLSLLAIAGELRPAARPNA